MMSRVIYTTGELSASRNLNFQFPSPSPVMTTKMENTCAFIIKTCQVKCFNALDFVNKPQELNAE